MTDTTPTPDDPQQSAQPPAEATTPPGAPNERESPSRTAEDDATTPDPDEGTTSGSARNREAAKYRTQLRDTQTELSTVQARLTMAQTTEAARIAGEVLAAGTDVFDIGGADLAAVLDPDTGQVDRDAVLALAEEVATDRPGLRAAAGWPDMGQGRKGAPPGGAGYSWADFFGKH